VDRNLPINIYESVGDTIGSVSYVQHMGEDLTIVNAARVSFGIEKEEVSEQDKKLIKYLIRNRHTSTLEHNVITYKFVVPLFVARQHMRHRTWSYNEVSRRYTNKDMRFYLPKTFRSQHDSNRQASKIDDINPIVSSTQGSTLNWTITAEKLVSENAKNALSNYKKLIEAGVAREQARMILPQNLYCEYYGTCNLNNLIKFYRLRVHDGAQWEIQQVAKACFDFVKNIWPEAMQAYLSIQGET